MKTVKRSFKEISKVLAIVLNFLLFGIVLGVTIYFLSSEGLEFNNYTFKGIECFKSFTILSNTYLGIICLISAILECVNFKKANYRLPYLVHVLKLSATVTTMLTFVAIVLYLGPKYGFLEMFEKEKVLYHFLNPWIAVLVYCVFEEKMKYNFFDYLLTLAPLFIYFIFYVILVSKGIWADYYGFKDGGKEVILAICCFLITIGITLLIHLLQHLITEVSKIHNYNFFNEDAIDAYTNKVFKAVFIIAPLASVFASFIYGICFVKGFFPPEKYGFVVIFALTSLSYIFLALWLVTKSFKKDGHLNKNAITRGKMYLLIFLPLQYNFITYTFPSTEFWAYSFFFIILACFFFDSRLIGLLEIEMVLTLVISWLIKPELLPARDDQFLVNMILRITCLALGYLSILTITRLGGKMLVRELEKISDYDPLTLLRSRRKMDKTIKELMKKSKNNALCLAMIDIDNFKKVNDQYGHEKGDEILRIVSNIIITSVHEDDLVFRFGGEEILVVFQTESEQALKTLQRISDKIREYKFYSNELEFHISVSIGIRQKHDNISYDELLEETDNNLYYAKEHGKNQICITQ